MFFAIYSQKIMTFWFNIISYSKTNFVFKVKAYFSFVKTVSTCSFKSKIGIYFSFGNT